MDLNGLEGRKLFIWVGSDVIFSLNLDNLHLHSRFDIVEMATRLPSIGTEFTPTPGGFFVANSRLHYLGGGGVGGPENNSDFNKKVFSFNLPSFSPDHSTNFPDHSGCKPRPILFTLSNKVYALATLPPASSDQPNIFEVYEPEFGKWKSLPAPPLLEALYTLRNHFVFRNKLILQTHHGDFIFDAVTENWCLDHEKVFPKCCALLEHEDLVFVLTREPFKLVAYESTSSSWKINEYSSSRVVEEIEENYFEFSKHYIVWASLTLVEKDCICLVFSSIHKFHISMFKFTKTTDNIIRAHVEAYHEFPNPVGRGPHYLIYKTFLWCPEVNEQDDTKADDTSAIRKLNDEYDSKDVI